MTGPYSRRPPTSGNTLRALERRIALLEQKMRGLDTAADAWGAAASSIFLLPGLVGFWPGGGIGQGSSTLDGATDRSGNGLHLTRNGGALLAYHESGLRVVMTFNGSTGYFTHADAAIFDIQGNETPINSVVNGLTIGGWFYREAGSATQGLMSKWIGSGDERSYRLNLESNDKVSFAVSSDGTSGNAVTVSTDAATSQDQWFFAAGRFDPSTEIAVWLDDVKATNTTSIPATIHAGTGTFQMGAINSVGGNLLDGRSALCFLCAAAVPDAIINNLFQQTRKLFGV